MKRVTWAILLDEDIAEASAVVAPGIMPDPASAEDSFNMTDEQGRTVRVELSKAGGLRSPLGCAG